MAGDPADGHRRLVLLRHDHKVAEGLASTANCRSSVACFVIVRAVGIRVRRCDPLPHVVLALASREVSDLLKAQERQAPVQPGVFVFAVLPSAEQPHVARTAPGDHLSQLLRDQEAAGMLVHTRRRPEHGVEPVADPATVQQLVAATVAYFRREGRLRTVGLPSARGDSWRGSLRSAPVIVLRKEGGQRAQRLRPRPPAVLDECRAGSRRPRRSARAPQPAPSNPQEEQCSCGRRTTSGASSSSSVSSPT